MEKILQYVIALLLVICSVGNNTKGQRPVEDHPSYDYYNDYKFWSVGLGYSKFCQEISYGYEVHGNMLKGDIGVNIFGTQYYYSSKYEKNHADYTRLNNKSSTVKPIFDFCASYLRSIPLKIGLVLSLGGGCGLLCSDDIIVEDYEKVLTDQISDEFGPTYCWKESAIGQKKLNAHFLMRPVFFYLKIPVNADRRVTYRKNWYIVAGWGYNYVFCPTDELNGFYFNIGFKKTF